VGLFLDFFPEKENKLPISVIQWMNFKKKGIRRYGNPEKVERPKVS
jgi:hypothetical protein